MGGGVQGRGQAGGGVTAGRVDLRLGEEEDVAGGLCRVRRCPGGRRPAGRPCRGPTPRRSAPMSRAPRRPASRRSRPRRSAPARSARRRSGPSPRTRALAAARTSPTSSWSSSRSRVSSWTGPSVPHLQQPVPGGLRRGVRRTAQHLAQVREHLVHPPHHRQHGRHLAEVVVLPPGRAAVRHLRHLLPGPEAVEDRAPRPAALAQVRVDGAAVVLGELRAGHPARLVGAEAGRAGVRQQHAAQREAARAVGRELRLGGAPGQQVERSGRHRAILAAAPRTGA